MLVFHRRPRAASATCQVVLQGIHVGREASNLPEHVNEVQVKADTDEVQGSYSNAGVERHMDDGGSGKICLEKAGPAVIVASLRDPVLVRI